MRSCKRLQRNDVLKKITHAPRSSWLAGIALTLLIAGCQKAPEEATAPAAKPAAPTVAA